MNARTIFSAVALTLFAVCSSATAQTYTLGYDQTRYDVTPGETVDVSLILTEEITGAEVSRLASGGVGLFGFELGIDYSAFTDAATGSTYNSVDFNPNFFQEGEDFTGGFVNNENGFVQFVSNSRDQFGEGVTGAELSSTVFELELLTATFDAGALGSITTLTARNEPSSILGVPIFFADGATPDLAFGSNSQIFVNAVPEPGSATILALIAGAGVLARRRK